MHGNIVARAAAQVKVGDGAKAIVSAQPFPGDHGICFEPSVLERVPPRGTAGQEAEPILVLEVGSPFIQGS